MRYKRPSARTFDRPFWAPHDLDPRGTDDPGLRRVARSDGTDRPAAGEELATRDAHGQAALLEEAESVDLHGGDEPGETDGERRVVHPHGYRRSVGVGAAGVLLLAVAIWKPWTAIAPQPDTNVPAPVEQVQAAQQTAPADAGAGGQNAPATDGTDAGVWAYVPGVAQDVAPTPAPAPAGGQQGAPEPGN